MNHYSRRKAEEQNCLHSIHQEHTLCFYMRNRDNYIVSFRYHSIDPYDVAFPGKTVMVGGCRSVTGNAESREAILEECKLLNVQGWDSILMGCSRLNGKSLVLSMLFQK